MKVTVSRTIAAAPEAVWDVIADPHRHIKTLPSSVSQCEVSESGEISCVVSAMGQSERMRVRRTVLEPPRRLVEERVDGTRSGTTEFQIAPQGAGSHVTLTAEIGLPMLLAGLAKGPVTEGLEQQLANLERESGA
ncbi:MAG: Polyketide cyclase / dehydrase and lipid transport [Gaiellales bacterium]|nr:Polyketide cyclase / dehydrase and lipid transport [Gaiellales bacterium]MDX6551292.1 Polyketide cyclase / dehydrase and lipid transport [Gaiellales bacterium]